MFFNWKGIAFVLGALAVVIGLIALNLQCSDAPEHNSQFMRIKGELAEGKKAMRYQEAENLARLARDLRSLAQRYKANGENKKAQRAIGAAQELDKKIARLLE